MASTIRIFMLKTRIGHECLASQNTNEKLFLSTFYFMEQENVEDKLFVAFRNDCTSHKNLGGTLPYPWFGSESAVSKSKAVSRSLPIILDVVRG